MIRYAICAAIIGAAGAVEGAALAEDVRSEFEAKKASYAGRMIPENCVIQLGLPDYPEAAAGKEGWVFVESTPAPTKLWGGSEGVVSQSRVRFIQNPRAGSL